MVNLGGILKIYGPSADIMSIQIFDFVTLLYIFFVTYSPAVYILCSVGRHMNDVYSHLNLCFRNTLKTLSKILFKFLY